MTTSDFTALRALLEALTVELPWHATQHHEALFKDGVWESVQTPCTIAAALPAAQAALERVENEPNPERTRSVLLSAGWKETNRQLDAAQALIARLEEALRDTLEIVRLQVPDLYEALDVARGAVEERDA